MLLIYSVFGYPGEPTVIILSHTVLNVLFPCSFFLLVKLHLIPLSVISTNSSGTTNVLGINSSVEGRL